MIYENPINGMKYPVPWHKDEAISLKISRYVSDEECAECQSYPVVRYVESDVCLQCANSQAQEDWKLWLQGCPGRPDPFPTSISEAVKLGINHYYTGILCKGGDHLIKRHIKSNKCLICVENSLPRKVDTAVNKFMQENPDLIIDKDTASMLNMRVYRTGQPCRRGHKGWRYVNGGACLTCMRPRSYPANIVMRDDTQLAISVKDQAVLFVGYARSGNHMLGLEGKKLNSTQFDSMFDAYRFVLKDGGSTYSAYAAFKGNFS